MFDFEDVEGSINYEKLFDSIDLYLFIKGIGLVENTQEELDEVRLFG